MSDAEAFFAKKKKGGKKAFKFNANLVDVSTVTQTVHVDAPSLSTEHDQTAVGVMGALSSMDVNKGDTKSPADEQWDDEALAASTLTRKAAAAQTANVIDMKSLDTKRNNVDNIAEKLRVEETKAQLAKAREGMEAAGAKLKEEREKKDHGTKEAGTGPRFGAAMANAGAGGVGSKWLPPHLRPGAAGVSAPTGRFGGSTTPKFDVQNEELFPDLAAADKILEKKEKEHQAVFKVPKKTPVGGGAHWASKTSPPVTATPSEPAKTEPDENEAKLVEQIQEETKTPAPSVSVGTASKVAQTKVPLKKKKKDLSTFKPASS